MTKNLNTKKYDPKARLVGFAEKEIPMFWTFWHSYFGFVSIFGFRYSNLLRFGKRFYYEKAKTFGIST